MHSVLRHQPIPAQHSVLRTRILLRDSRVY
jgi:hypothetical protein